MERWNLTLRMQNRRFTRLTNGFSKKLANQQLHARHHDGLLQLLPEHRSLKGQTPAMVAGLTEYQWSASDLLALDLWHAAAA